MFDIDEIRNILGHNALVENIDTVPKGHIRIETGFLYPDGASIDLFIDQQHGTLPGLQGPRLSDFGNTWSWLQNFEMAPNKSQASKLYFNRILELYHCSFSNVALQHELDRIEDLPAGIIRLGQACMRTADLIYSKRLRVQSTFNQSVEDIIGEIAVDFEPAGEIRLTGGNVVKVDFRVKGPHRETAIQTLSSGNAQYAHQRAVEINARWDDILALSDWTQHGNQCLTLFDDSSNVYDTQDLKRIERKSLVLPVSDVETLSTMLLAA